MNWLYPFLLFLSLSLRPFSLKNLTFSYPPFRTLSSQISFHFFALLKFLPPPAYLFLFCLPYTPRSPFSKPLVTHQFLLTFSFLNSPSHHFLFPIVSHLTFLSSHTFFPVSSLPFILTLPFPLCLSLYYSSPFLFLPPPIIEEGRGQYSTFIIVYWNLPQDVFSGIVSSSILFSIRYDCTVCGGRGRDEVSGCVGGHILQDFYTLYVTRFRTYKNLGGEGVSISKQLPHSPIQCCF